ncbi:hypothetical protein M409DRAFT_21288 [Zasmidium cellare ATCC 36951]|uniref:Uncharacterized protein n=1 Tax=Zasmidium cellare ATCC 36951 TaxID=1080233 RepID=A0A6A6CQR6_ZASCE|nr:uncharacterized protein M409DRAFT_21288 [Zasmidium cellare ATCC 36951]KAF2168538.1 hypothetical protein M409DRAFT_21288 [Zasmidium cellare ATCC 36951]
MGPGPGQDGPVCLTSFLETDSRLEVSLFDLLKDIQDYAAQVIRESETASWEAQPTRNPKEKEETSQGIPRKAMLFTTGLLEALAQSISALFRLSSIARDSGGMQNVELEYQPIQAVLVKRRMVMARAYLSSDPPKPAKQSLDAAVEEAVAEINHAAERLEAQSSAEDNSSLSKDEQNRDRRSLPVQDVEPFDTGDIVFLLDPDGEEIPYKVMECRFQNGKIHYRLETEDGEIWEDEQGHSWVEHAHISDGTASLPTRSKPATSTTEGRTESTKLDPVVPEPAYYIDSPPLLPKTITPPVSPSLWIDADSLRQQQSGHNSLESVLCSHPHPSASNRDPVVHRSRGDDTPGSPKEPPSAKPDDYPKAKAQEPQRPPLQGVLQRQAMNLGNRMRRFLPSGISRGPASINAARFQKLSSVYLRLQDEEGTESGWSERLLVRQIRGRRGMRMYQLKDMMDKPYEGGRFFEESRLRRAPANSESR